MKRWLFYISAIPLGTIVLLIDLVQSALDAVASAFSATNELYHVVLARYEYWAFDVPKYDYFVNSPFNDTLRQQWVKEFKRAWNRDNGPWSGI
jgi:1,2-phenylacetyl-CoA epoxidase catalytic subunit